MDTTELDKIWQKTAAERFGIVFCGGSDRGYAHAIEQLLLVMAQEYCVALFGSEAAFQAPPNASVVCNPQLSGQDFARMALRQDPDCLVLDRRSTEALEILTQAKLTGHRVVRHDALSLDEAFEAQRTGVAGMGDFLVREVLLLELFVAIDERGIAEIRQVQVQESEQIGLVTILRRDESCYVMAGELQTQFRAPSGPPPVPEVMSEIPEEWPSLDSPIAQQLEASLGSTRRLTYAPVLDLSGAPCRLGHFGGLPQIGPAAPWPTCGDCGTPMSLILEIELAESPLDFQKLTAGSGVFQFFYCCSDSCDCAAAWEPFQKNSCSRIVGGQLQTASEVPDAHVFEQVGISKWEALYEGPAWEERREFLADSPLPSQPWYHDLEEVGHYLSEPEMLETRFKYLLDHFSLGAKQAQETLSVMTTYTGDKLLGWPWWSQGVEYPHCSECGERMAMICQINNDGSPKSPVGHSSAVGQVFAGDGNGHVYRCLSDGTMTFAWACG